MGFSASTTHSGNMTGVSVESSWAWLTGTITAHKHNGRTTEKIRAGFICIS
jgi:hypothetical protein